MKRLSGELIVMLFVVSTAFAQSHVRPFDIETTNLRPAVSVDTNPFRSTRSSIPVHPVDTFVENVRSILGAGRNIVRYNGDVQIALLEGTTGSYELYWGGSDDNGVTWDSFFSGHLGTAQPADDRYPALAVNANGTYIAYHENSAPNSQGYVLHNPNPFVDPDGFTPYGPLTPPGEDNWISFIYADQTGNGVAYGWFDFVNGNVNVGVSSDGVTFPNATPVYTGDAGFGPAVAIQGSYVFVSFISADSGIAPTDTAITNHLGGNGGQWFAFVESGDGGVTWTPPQPIFGMNLSDFPQAQANLEGTAGWVTAAGGTNWRNHTQPVIHYAKIFVPTSNTAITLNDGVFPNGYWDGMTISGGSYKSISDTEWMHISVSDVEQLNGQFRGEAWYPELSVIPGHPDYWILTYTDIAPYPNEVHALTFYTDYLAWFDYIYVGDSDLGITDVAAEIVISTSPFARLLPYGVYLDMVFLGDNGGVFNTTLYHTELEVLTVDIQYRNGPLPEIFSLAENYPNPFNSSTTIRFRLPAEGIVSLNVFNALGQKIRTLVDGPVGPGEHAARFDGTGLASGLYFYSLTFNGQT